jgi:hypothetical protein
MVGLIMWTFKALWTALLVVIGLAFILALAKPSTPSTATPTATSVSKSDGPPFQCTKAAVPLPNTNSHLSNLKDCQTQARAVLKAMLTNLKVTVACREEYPPRLRSNSQAAKAVRDSNDGVRRLMPQVELYSEKQIRSKDTLDSCLKHVSDAAKFADLQPEFRGKWW